MRIFLNLDYSLTHRALVTKRSFSISSTRCCASGPPRYWCSANDPGISRLAGRGQLGGWVIRDTQLPYSGHVDIRRGPRGVYVQRAFQILSETNKKKVSFFLNRIS